MQFCKIKGHRCIWRESHLDYWTTGITTRGCYIMGSYKQVLQLCTQFLPIRSAVWRLHSSCVERVPGIGVCTRFMCRFCFNHLYLQSPWEYRGRETLLKVCWLEGLVTAWIRSGPLLLNIFEVYETKINVDNHHPYDHIYVDDLYYLHFPDHVLKVQLLITLHSIANYSKLDSNYI